MEQTMSCYTELIAAQLEVKQAQEAHVDASYKASNAYKHKQNVHADAVIANNRLFDAIFRAEKAQKVLDDCANNLSDAMSIEWSAKVAYESERREL
jgi:hypothetical protein